MQQLSNTNVYAIRCANPNYSWAQHLADASRTGTCQQQNLASSKAQWDFVVLQVRVAHPSLRQPEERLPHLARCFRRLHMPRKRSTDCLLVEEKEKCWSKETDNVSGTAVTDRAAWVFCWSFDHMPSRLFSAKAGLGAGGDGAAGAWRQLVRWQRGGAAGPGSARTGAPLAACGFPARRAVC